MEEPSPVDIPRSKAEWLIPLVLFAVFGVVCGFWFLRQSFETSPFIAPFEEFLLQFLFAG